MRWTVTPPTLAIALMALVGCSSPPTLTPTKLELGPAGALTPPSRVLVSGFFSGDDLGSFGGGSAVARLRQAVGVRDVSPELAELLNARGVKARAYVGREPGDLEPGALLIRGVVDRADHKTRYAGNFIGTVATVGIYGMYLVPYFVPVLEGSQMDVSIQVVDRTGRVVLSGDERITAHHERYWLWTTFGRSVSEKRAHVDLALAAIADALTEVLRPGSGPGRSTPSETKRENP